MICISIRFREMADTGKSNIARVVTSQLYISKHLESLGSTMEPLVESGDRHVLLGSSMYFASWD